VPEKFTIVDGSGYIFRAYFALKQARSGGRNIDMTTSYGMPTGALHVFSAMLMRLYLDERPELCAVVFDAEGKTFRHEISEEYKSTRKEKPPDLVPQFPYFQRIARAFNLPVLAEPRVEADDVIATLTKRARAIGLDVVIYTGDKDLMQLVDDHVTCIDAMREITYTPARVAEKFGVPPKMVGDWLALRGDSTDNIPGVAGVGEVTATKLLLEWGSIDNLLAHASELKGKLAQTFQDPVQLAALAKSRKLVALVDDVALPEILTLRRKDWDARELADIFRALEFNRFLSRLEAVFVSDRDKYETILDEAALDRALAAARAAKELALNIVPDDRHGIVGIALFAPGIAPSYVPIGHRYLGVPVQLKADAVLAKLKPLLEDPAIAKTIFDYKTEWGILHRRGIELRGVASDPSLAAHLLDPSAPTNRIEPLAKQHLDHEMLQLKDLMGKGRERRGTDELDVAIASKWGAEDVDVGACLGKLFTKRLETAGMTKLLHDVEIPLARVLGLMEAAGIKIDVQLLREPAQEIGEEAHRLEQEIHRLAGYPVNPGSPKQLNELLFERLGLRSDRMRRTASGAFSTDAEQLEELVGTHEIVKPILEHRELVKLKGTYLDALPSMVDPRDGRLHTRYSQVSASTGRLASEQPNIQNIPIRTPLGKRIRRAFVAEPGHLLVSADYSQIELRVIAHLSGDPVLTSAFQAGRDVHAQTAAEVFGVPIETVTADHRRVAKAVNYGLGYGQTDFGLARVLDIPREDARRYIDTYFARFAGVRDFMERLIADARKTQVVQTIGGRRIPIHDLHSTRFPDRAAAERFARNAPIQGSAADILKVAMLEIQGILESGEFPGARMLLTVHDELVFEVPEAQAKDLAAAVKRSMEHAMDRSVPLAVPLIVDVGVAASWADAH
jgi:DNA polymerase-1